MKQRRRMDIRSYKRRSKFRRKLIEKYSTRWFNINKRPIMKNISFPEQKKHRKILKPQEAVCSDIVEIKVEQPEPEPEAERVRKIEHFEDGDLFIDGVAGHVETCDNTLGTDCDFNENSQVENTVEKWNLVSSMFHSYLLERVTCDLSSTPSKRKKRKKIRYTGSSKKVKSDNDHPDPYLSHHFAEEGNKMECVTAKKVAVLVHLGVKRPIFPRIYRNIVAYCGMANDRVDQITDSWAELALSSLVGKDESRIKPVVFPVVEKSLLGDIQDFNEANDIPFHKIEVVKENSAVPQIELAAATMKPDPEEFDMDSMKVVLEEESPVKNKELPFIVSNVRSLKNCEKSLRSPRERKSVQRDYDNICPAKPYYFNMTRTKSRPRPSARVVDWNAVARGKGFKPCKVVLEKLDYHLCEKRVDVLDYQIEADLRWFDQVVKNDSAVIHLPEVEACKKSPPLPQYVYKEPSVHDEDDTRLKNNFFGPNQCTRTYGIMIDYAFRNRSTVFLYKMRKSLKYQSKYNKYFQNGVYLHMRRNATEQQRDFVVDVEETSSVKCEPIVVPDDVMSANPLRAFKIPASMSAFGTSLLRDVDAVSKHTDRIQRVDLESLRSVTNAKWIIVEMRTDLESVVFKMAQPFPATLLFEIMYRADLSKMLVHALQCDAAAGTAMPNFGIYGVPGLYNAVIIGPISVRDRSSTLTATTKSPADTLERFDIPILSARPSVSSSSDAVIAAAWWWRPGTNDSGISCVMDAFLNYHFKFRMDAEEECSKSAPPTRLSSLLSIHRAVSYFRTLHKSGEVNHTLVHDESQKSLRSEKWEPLPTVDLDTRQDDSIEEEAIAIDPPIEDEDVTSFSYRDKRRTEKRRLARLHHFHRNMQQWEHPPRRFFGAEAEEKRVAEQLRRVEFRKNKFYLCWVLGETPEKFSLNATILQAVCEIRKLEAENNELDAERLEMVHSRNKLGLRLMKIIKTMDPRSQVYKAIKLSISKIFRSSSSGDAENNAVEHNEEEFNKVYQRSMKNGSVSQLATKSNTYSANKYRYACTKRRRKARKSMRSGCESANANSSIQDTDLLQSSRYLRYCEIEKNYYEKLVSLRDHDYLFRAKSQTPRSPQLKEKHIRLVLLEYNKRVYNFGVRRMIEKDEEALKVMKETIETIYQDVKKNVNGRVLVKEPPVLGYVKILVAMLNLDMKVSKVIQLNDRSAKYQGASVTSIISLNERYMCRIVCDDLINDTNMRLRCGLDFGFGVEENRYIDNVLSPDVVECDTSVEKQNNLPFGEAIGNPENRYGPSVLRRRDGRKSTVICSSNKTRSSVVRVQRKSKMSTNTCKSRTKVAINKQKEPPIKKFYSRNKLIKILPKPRELNCLPVGMFNTSTSENILRNIVIPPKPCVVKFVPQTKNILVQKELPVKLINSNVKVANLKSNPASAGYSLLNQRTVILNRPNKQLLKIKSGIRAPSKEEVASLLTEPLEKIIEQSTNGNKESPPKSVSHMSSTKSFQNLISEDAASKAGGESDLASMRLQVKSFASINSLTNTLPTNVVKLLK